jgi:hypothetical protein
MYDSLIQLLLVNICKEDIIGNLHTKSKELKLRNTKEFEFFVYVHIYTNVNNFHYFDHHCGL